GRGARPGLAAGAAVAAGALARGERRSDPERSAGGGDVRRVGAGAGGVVAERTWDGREAGRDVMIDRAVLARELARRVSALEADLRARDDEVPEVAEVVEAQWREAREAGRTAHDLPVWRESLFTQVAVGWVLAPTFVRFCEDNGLIPDPVISGPGERRRRA